MPIQTIYTVQQFEKQGKKLVAGRQMPFKTSSEAVARAGRDAARFPGVVAVQQTIDTDTGEITEDPVILARHGELPPELRDE